MPFTSRSSAAALRPPGCNWPTAPPRVSSARGRRGAVRASPAPQCAPVRGGTRPHPPPPVCQREPEGKRAGVGGLTCSTASCPASSPSRLKDMAAPSAAPPSPWGASAVRFRVLRPVVPRADAGTNGERGAAEPRGTTGAVVLRRTSALGPEGRGTTTPSGLRAGPERGRGAAGRPAMAGGREHRVGPGDTLPGLALRYGVTVSAGRGGGLSPQRAPRRHSRVPIASRAGPGPALCPSHPRPHPFPIPSPSPSSHSLSAIPSHIRPVPSHPRSRPDAFPIPVPIPSLIPPPRPHLCPTDGADQTRQPPLHIGHHFPEAHPPHPPPGVPH